MEEICDYLIANFTFHNFGFKGYFKSKNCRVDFPSDFFKNITKSGTITQFGNIKIIPKKNSMVGKKRFPNQFTVELPRDKNTKLRFKVFETTRIQISGLRTLEEFKIYIKKLIDFFNSFYELTDFFIDDYKYTVINTNGKTKLKSEIHLESLKEFLINEKKISPFFVSYKVPQSKGLMIYIKVRNKKYKTGKLNIKKYHYISFNVHRQGSLICYGLFDETVDIGLKKIGKYVYQYQQWLLH